MIMIQNPGTGWHFLITANSLYVNDSMEQTWSLYRGLTVHQHEHLVEILHNYSKSCVKWTLSKRPKIGFQEQLSHNAGLKHCRMLQGEHSAILLTFIKLPFVIKIFVMYIFE